MELEFTVKGSVAYLTIDREASLNTLTPDLMRELEAACTKINEGPNIRVGIVTGKGPKAFCAGADIKQWLPFVARTREHPEEMPKTPMRGMKMKKPLIAAVNGYALGGDGELAMACDIRVASSNAVFGWPESSLGILPRLGGTQRLPRLIGLAKAREILLTGRRIKAPEALELGLVSDVVEPGELMAKAEEYAERICALAPLSVEYIKRCIDEGCQAGIDEGMELENTLGLMLYDTEDYEEGRKAFAEKRKPNFKGR